jgi:hypothetical protein
MRPVATPVVALARGAIKDVEVSPSPSPSSSALLPDRWPAMRREAHRMVRPQALLGSLTGLEAAQGNLSQPARPRVKTEGEEEYTSTKMTVGQPPRLICDGRRRQGIPPPGDETQA